MSTDLPTAFDVSDSLKLRPGDYVVPGLRQVVLDACFPKMKEGDIKYVYSRLLSLFSGIDTLKSLLLNQY